MIVVLIARPTRNGGCVGSDPVASPSCLLVPSERPGKKIHSPTLCRKDSSKPILTSLRPQKEWIVQSYSEIRILTSYRLWNDCVCLSRASATSALQCRWCPRMRIKRNFPAKVRNTNTGKVSEFSQCISIVDQRGCTTRRGLPKQLLLFFNLCIFHLDCAGPSL